MCDTLDFGHWPWFGQKRSDDQRTRMSMKLPTHLHTAALDAHDRGEHFADFFPTVADQLQKLAPFSREHYRRLHGELLCLVVCGNTDGMFAAGDPDAHDPRILDGQRDSQPDDAVTRARVQLP